MIGRGGVVRPRGVGKRPRRARVDVDVILAAHQKHRPPSEAGDVEDRIPRVQESFGLGPDLRLGPLPRPVLEPRAKPLAVGTRRHEGHERAQARLLGHGGEADDARGREPEPADTRGVEVGPRFQVVDHASGVRAGARGQKRVGMGESSVPEDPDRPARRVRVRWIVGVVAREGVALLEESDQRGMDVLRAQESSRQDDRARIERRAGRRQERHGDLRRRLVERDLLEDGNEGRRRRDAAVNRGQSQGGAWHEEKRVPSHGRRGAPREDVPVG